MSKSGDSESVSNKTDTRDSNRDDLDPNKVHSANSWESADMGDDDRKKKFLRLMGASKKEHSGRFVIGDKESTPKHSRAKDDTDKVNRELEEQYKRSNEHKVTRYTHHGLGFDDNRPDSVFDQAKPSTDNVISQSDEKKLAETAERKRENTEPDSTSSSPPKKPKMMMAFVKASD